MPFFIWYNQDFLIPTSAFPLLRRGNVRTMRKVNDNTEHRQLLHVSSVDTIRPAILTHLPFHDLYSPGFRPALHYFFI